MAAFDLDEQEQISELKAWWAQYGNMITAVVVVIAAGVVGWTGWQQYQAKQSTEAAGLYAQVEKVVAEQNPQKTRELAGRILENFGSTIYADLAALQSAGVQVKTGDLPNARAQLQWVVEKGSDASLRDIARLRLVAVLTDEGKFDEALAQLKTVPDLHKARFEEARGDVLAAQGKTEDARAAWQSALSALDLSEVGADRVKRNLETKLETVGQKG